MVSVCVYVCACVTERPYAREWRGVLVPFPHCIVQCQWLRET